MAEAAAQIRVCQILDFKGGKILTCEDYAYRRDKQSRGNQLWRCTITGCPGRAKTDCGNPPVILSMKAHNHIPNEEKAVERRAKAELCERAKNNRTVSLSQVSTAYFMARMVDE